MFFMIKIISNPTSSFLIIFLQLIAGALLGADISIALSGKINTLAHFDFNTLTKVWSMLSLTTKNIVLITIGISFMKSIADFIAQSIEKKNQEKINEDNKRKPDTFIISYYQSKFLSKIDILNSNLNGDIDKEKISDTLKEVIFIIRNFAAVWDVKPIESYNCNIMFYLSKSERTDTIIINEWERNKHFFNATNAKSASEEVSGILLVAASSDKHDGKLLYNIDDQYTGFLLPVSLDESLNPQVIPGAPQAFKDGQFQYSSNVLNEFSDWIYQNQHRYIKPAQAEGIFDYYLKDKTGRSLLSLPCGEKISIVEDGNETVSGYKVVAVLNIYSSDYNMLRNNPHLFYEFCRPLLSIVASCYWLLLKIEELEPKI